MKPGSKKNIRPVLADVKRPGTPVPKTTSTEFFKPRKEKALFISSGQGVLKKAVVALIIVLIIAGTGFGWDLLDFKNEA